MRAMGANIDDGGRDGLPLVITGGRLHPLEWRMPVASAQIKNGYGDINKSVVTFLDGHTRYMNMIPGGESDPNRLFQPWLVPAYCNSEYTVVFPDLR